MVRDKREEIFSSDFKFKSKMVLGEEQLSASIHYKAVPQFFFTLYDKCIVLSGHFFKKEKEIHFHGEMESDLK